MLYRILADFVLLVHGLFIAFVVFGGVLALWRRQFIPWHLAALVWGVAVIGFGWICPLTPLENALRLNAEQVAYSDGFIEHYITSIIYPPGLTRSIQMMLAVALIGCNAVIYGVLYIRVRRHRQP